MKSNFKNILMLILASISLFILWQIGLKWAYASVLKFLSNVFFSIGGNYKVMFDPKAESPALCLAKLLDNGKMVGTYCMQLKLYSLAVVLMVSWQIVLFFNLKLKKALKILLINMSIFLLAQVLIFSMLSLRDTHSFFSNLYEGLRQSSIMIALVLIIKDNIMHSIIRTRFS